MAKGKIAVIAFMIVLLLPFCSGTETQTRGPAKKNIKDHFKKFITMETLEKAGFERFDGKYFNILFNGKDFYILHYRDYLIAKFTGNKLQRVFKTQKGQAPKEMINPLSIFLYDKDTIAIFDFTRSIVFFFDLDLNYIKEMKLKSQFERMDRVGKTLVATLSIKRKDNVFAILDNDFKIIKTIVKANKKPPFERFFPRFLNAGFFAGNKIVAHSYWVFPFKKCSVDFLDLKGDLAITLYWEQPLTPTAKTFKDGNGLYSCSHVGKHGSYYTVQCYYSKVLFGPKFYEFMVFGPEGTLERKVDFPYTILDTSNRGMDTKIYFMDDDEGISFINVVEFMSSNAKKDH